MSLNKVNYVDGVTVITAENMNDIQDAIIDLEAGTSITVDGAISATSTNPVQNKVIAAALNQKADSTNIPTKVSQLTNDSGFQTASQVERAINGHLSSVYKAGGSVSSISDLPTPSLEYLGYVYDVETAFTTTAQFVEGAGVDYPAGTDVAIVAVEIGGVMDFRFDAMSGFVDLSGYIEKPANAVADDFLCFNGTTWVAKTVPNANGVSF